MKIKKILALLLVAAMMFVLVAACAPSENGAADPAPVETPAPDPTPAPTPAPIDPDDPDADLPPEDNGGTFSNITTQVPVEPLGVTATRQNTLIVGYAVASTGDFIHGRTNSAYDWTIRALLQGDVGTVVSDVAGNIYVNNRVVENVWVVDDAAGNRTYTFQIAEGFYWSDGTPITAFDFVATVLMRSSPEWLFEAGNAQDGTQNQDLVGRAAFAAPLTIVDPDWVEPEADEDEEADPEPPPRVPNPDRAEYFEGVRMINDMTFSLTIDADNLPYFFELVMVTVAPWPGHVMFPGMSVVTNENGSRMSEDTLDATHAFSEGYRFNPTVVAGPYTFVSFENNIVTVARNPMFGGDAHGRMPQIDFIQQMMAADEVADDMMFAGEIDLLPDNLEMARIERVMGEPGFDIHQYIRFGYGVVNFQLWGGHLPVADVNVRHALAHVIDRQAVLDAFLGGFGSLIDTHASPGQWMWQARGAEALSLMTSFSVNHEVANNLLDETDWRFEADGETPFDREQANAQGTYLRHNAEGEVLHIRSVAGNPALGLVIEIQTVENAAMAGMLFTNEDADWVAVTIPNVTGPWNLPQEELIFSTFTMGTGFTAVFDPFLTFHSSRYGQTLQATIADPVLDEAMERMRRTVPGDYEAFLDGWLDFVVRFNEVLPVFPLYNNIWIDFHNERLLGMEAVGDLASWADSITQLSLAD